MDVALIVLLLLVAVVIGWYDTLSVQRTCTPVGTDASLHRGKIVSYHRGAVRPEEKTW